jgi:hypothetical protein
LEDGTDEGDGRKTLKEAHKRNLIDHESFLAYGVGLSFLVLGVVGVLGSDDLLAAFIAGNRSVTLSLSPW